jgi:hypothetical protein
MIILVIYLFRVLTSVDKFEDVNKDGKLGFEDKQSLGNTIPKVTFGISPSFKFKGFDLNILMQGILGVNMFNQNNFTNLTYENRVVGERWLNSWTPTNTNTNINTNTNTNTNSSNRLSINRSNSNSTSNSNNRI